MCYCLLVSSGSENWSEALVPCVYRFLFSSRSFWLFWFSQALTICLYSLSQCQRLCWVCSGGRQSLFGSSKAFQELNIHWVLGVRIGWQACTTTPTLPADFTQQLSTHPLSRTQSDSTQPEADQSLGEYTTWSPSQGRQFSLSHTQVQPRGSLGWSNLCWGAVLCLAM